MAKQPRWREFLTTDAGPLGSFLGVMTAVLVSTLLDGLLGHFFSRFAPPQLVTLAFVLTGVVVGMLVYSIVGRMRIKKDKP